MHIRMHIHPTRVYYDYYGEELHQSYLEYQYQYNQKTQLLYETIQINPKSEIRKSSK